VPVYSVWIRSNNLPHIQVIQKWRKVKEIYHTSLHGRPRRIHHQKLPATLSHQFRSEDEPSAGENPHRFLHLLATNLDFLGSWTEESRTAAANWELELLDLALPGLTKAPHFPWMNDDRGSPWRARSATPGNGRGDWRGRSTSYSTSRGGWKGRVGEAEAAPRGKGAGLRAGMRRPAEEIVGTPHGNGMTSWRNRAGDGVGERRPLAKVPSEKGGLTSGILASDIANLLER
jgi:hypothetical protein